MKQIRKTRLEHQLEGGVLKDLNLALAREYNGENRVEVRRASSTIPPARAAYDVVLVWTGVNARESVLRSQVTINEVKVFLEGALAFKPM